MYLAFAGCVSVGDELAVSTQVPSRECVSVVDGVLEGECVALLLLEIVTEMVLVGVAVSVVEGVRVGDGESESTKNMFSSSHVSMPTPGFGVREGAGNTMYCMLGGCVIWYTELIWAAVRLRLNSMMSSMGPWKTSTPR